MLVHEYQRMDIKLMIDVIENRLDDLLLFVDCVLSASNSHDHGGRADEAACDSRRFTKAEP